MTLFITSSPYVENADRALLSNANGFVDRLRQALPPFPRGGVGDARHIRRFAVQFCVGKPSRSVIIARFCEKYQRKSGKISMKIAQLFREKCRHHQKKNGIRSGAVPSWAGNQKSQFMGVRA